MNGAGAERLKGLLLLLGAMAILPAMDAMATSERRCAWIRIASSGVRRFFSPSRCERNVTPSSSTSRRSASENT